jgi:hypothetical protein
MEEVEEAEAAEEEDGELSGLRRDSPLCDDCDSCVDTTLLADRERACSRACSRCHWIAVSFLLFSMIAPILLMFDRCSSIKSDFFGTSTLVGAKRVK